MPEKEVPKLPDIVNEVILDEKFVNMCPIYI
jgi:hypothetical protein